MFTELTAGTVVIGITSDSANFQMDLPADLPADLPILTNHSAVDGLDDVQTPKYNYDTDVQSKYREFVYLCACYNINTSTDILVRQKCRLFSAKKIRTLVREFMDERRLVETLADVPEPATVDMGVPSSSLLPSCDHTRAILLLDIASLLPSYARIGGGMLICALAEYMTVEQWNEQLDYLAAEQSERLLWSETFIRAGIILSDCVVTGAACDNFIEAEAEKIPVKLSFMKNDEYVEVTFID